MKCPICGEEMVIGQIESGREINWIQEGEKPVRISSRLFVSSKADAKRCAECGIVIVNENGH